MTVIEYLNGTIAKYKNRRVMVAPLPNDEFSIKTKVLDGNLSARATHDVIGGKIVLTSLKLSREGALALYTALGNELERTENKCKS